MYRALVRFADLQDGKRIYEAGEPFPRPGFDVTQERLSQLASSDNRMGYPLIAEENSAEEQTTDAPVKKTRRRKG